MSKKKRILIAALNWGLGHATRCVPLINYLKEKNVDIFLASDGKSLVYLKNEFPGIDTFILPGYNVQYHKYQKTWFQLIKQLPNFKKVIEHEHEVTNQLVREHDIDIIISDNRYGCYSDITQNIFITHQLNIQVPGALWWTSVMLQKRLNNYINHFDECWIPDIPNEQNSLSGNLSHPAKLNIPVKYIGWLSRFNNVDIISSKFDHDILAIISGPEPQKTKLKELVIKQAIHLSKKTLIISGDPDLNNEDESKNVRVISHLPTAEFASAIKQAELVISRPGYTTLMDLSCFGKKAIFTPTPGQTEQEYLGRRVAEPHLAYVKKQSELSIAEALNNINRYQGIPKSENHSLFKTHVDLLVNSE